MSLKVGELRKAIADTPDDATVMLVYAGVMRHAVGITVAPNGAVAVVRGLGNPRRTSRFSIVEDGLIGGLNAMGMSDDQIAVLLERTTDSIKKRKKTLGIKGR